MPAKCQRNTCLCLSSVTFTCPPSAFFFKTEFAELQEDKQWYLIMIPHWIKPLCKHFISLTDPFLSSKYRNTHFNKNISIEAQRLYTPNDRVMQALHDNSDNVVRWWGGLMPNRQAFKQSTELFLPSQWIDSRWPENQAESECQILLRLTLMAVLSRKAKTTVRTFVNRKFTTHLWFSSYWMHKQASQRQAHM